MTTEVVDRSGWCEWPVWNGSYGPMDSRYPEVCARDDSHEYEQVNRRGEPATAETINAAKKAAKAKGEVA